MSYTDRPPLRLAVLVPCYNEAKSIEQVVLGFRASLPQAEIYVYDNNSTDETVAIAERAGAIVRSEQQQGKGNVVRRMFADIDADVYILVDGDSTYDAKLRVYEPSLFAVTLERPGGVVVSAQEHMLLTGAPSS